MMMDWRITKGRKRQTRKLQREAVNLPSQTYECLLEIYRTLLCRVGDIHSLEKTITEDSMIRASSQVKFWPPGTQGTALQALTTDQP